MRISIKGDCKAVASDFSLATSIALCSRLHWLRGRDGLIGEARGKIPGNMQHVLLSMVPFNQHDVYMSNLRCCHLEL